MPSGARGFVRRSSPFLTYPYLSRTHTRYVIPIRSRQSSFHLLLCPCCAVWFFVLSIMDKNRISYQVDTFMIKALFTSLRAACATNSSDMSGNIFWKIWKNQNNYFHYSQAINQSRTISDKNKVSNGGWSWLYRKTPYAQLANATTLRFLN